MKFLPWMVCLLSLALVACSGSKSAKVVDEEMPQIELSDADEFVDSPSYEDMAPEESISSNEPMESAPSFEDTDSMMETTPAPAPAPAYSEMSGGTKSYVVQKNETLMLIAFKLYGDYAKWKELASTNRELLGGSTNLKEGMTLQYIAPAEEFVWNPQGLPYLIRTGDTLGGISQNVYSTMKKWKLIWENNRPLIKDPNKIFAGFTIYYLENGREVAAEI